MPSSASAPAPSSPGPSAPRSSRAAWRAGGQRCQVSAIRCRAGRSTVGRMPEFLAETYAPRGAPGAAAPSAADIARAAGQASQPGLPGPVPGRHRRPPAVGHAAFRVTHHSPSISPVWSTTHACNHPITAVPPERHACLLPGAARQHVDHRPSPPAASRPWAAGRQRRDIPARKEHLMNRPTFTPALKRRARRLRLRHPAGYRPEPIPRIRWYT
jgi:hypothetical protein